ncbi:MAG: hypothetical protein M2R45_04914 [Verrucomicrobia subdivision 3 bacterium]|nr:hypothetical protein [Limisphaerales bacterium]MCS1417566.1 hypothetical protein [Limisphaerales bacterium]
MLQFESKTLGKSRRHTGDGCKSHALFQDIAPCLALAMAACLGVACSKSMPPAESSKEVAVSEESAASEPSTNQPPVVKESTNGPVASITTTEASEDTTPTSTEEPLKPSAPAAQAPQVKFPEMKMPEQQKKVRDLFVEANDLFGDKNYVGAIQTLRKLDEMELTEKQELALDLFLKRIEKALDDARCF